MAAKNMTNKSTGTTSHTVVMTKSKVCKNSVRYGNDGPNLPYDNVYVNKTAWPTMPEKIVVRIEPG